MKSPQILKMFKFKNFSVRLLGFISNEHLSAPENSLRRSL